MSILDDDLVDKILPNLWLEKFVLKYVCNEVYFIEPDGIRCLNPGTETNKGILQKFRQIPYSSIVLLNQIEPPEHSTHAWTKVFYFYNDNSKPCIYPRDVYKYFDYKALKEIINHNYKYEIKKSDQFELLLNKDAINDPDYGRFMQLANCSGLIDIIACPLVPNTALNKTL